MKVALTGASGSGKTVTANAIFEQLKDEYSIALIHELARYIFKEYQETYGFESLAELRRSVKHLQFQKDILREQIKIENIMSRKFDIVICDRTIFDSYLFAFLYGSPAEFEEYVTFFNKEIEKWQDYDKIFLLEYLKGVNVDDGFRTPDVGYRAAQEVILKNILPGYVYVPQKSLEVRVDEIIRHIIQ